jgi:hypothetical protein
MAIALAFGATSQGTTSGSSVTFSGIAIGTASADRVVLALVTMQLDATFGATCTIGGITATKLQEVYNTTAAPDIGCAIYAALVPTGTTANIVVTVSAGDGVVGISTVAMTGGAIPTAASISDTDELTGSGATITLAALTIPTSGGAVCVWANDTHATACAWTGMGEVSDANYNPHRHSVATSTTAGTTNRIADGATANQSLLGVAFNQGVILAPGLVTNTETFYAPTVVGDQVIAPALVSDDDTVYAPLVSQTRIYPALYSDADVFYTPTIGRTLKPSLFTDSSTTLLMHMDGADASTTFTEETGLTVTRAGNAQIDTAQSVFGGASALFDGNSDALHLPRTSGLTFGTGDFVVEGRFFLNADYSANPVGTPVLFDFWATDGNPNWQIFTGSTGILGTTGHIVLFINNVNHTLGTTNIRAGWHHVAVIRSSGQVKVFVDGVQQGSAVANTSNLTGVMSIGAQNDGTYSMVGWVDEVRVSKGTDLGWFSGFTPPTSAYSLGGDTFYTPKIVRDLDPAHYSDTDTFYTPEVTAGSSYAYAVVSWLSIEAAEGTVQTLTPALYTDADIFYAPVVSRTRIYPALHSDADTFYAPVVSQTGIYPALVTDADTFYSPLVSQTRVYPALVSDADSVYAPTVSQGAATILPGLHSDADTFYSPTVASGATALLPALVTDDDTVYSPSVTTGAGQIFPALYSDADVFYAPRVSQTRVYPALYSDADTIYAPNVVRIVRPALYSDTDTFYAPNVYRGVRPSLYSDADTFYAPTISAQNAIAPSLVTDADVIYGPSVTTGAGQLAPALYTDADVFYAPVVTTGSVTVAPALYSDADTVYAPSVGRVLGPALHTDGDTFYSPTVAAGVKTLLPSLYTDADTIYSAFVGVGAGELFPDLYSDGDTFYSPTLHRTVRPGLYSDDDTVYAPNVSIDLTWFPSLVSDADSFYSPTVEAQGQIVPVLFTDGDTFYAATVIPGAVSISPATVVNRTTFYRPHVKRQRMGTRTRGTPSYSRPRTQSYARPGSQNYRRTSSG